jgi:cytochrome c biogenesis protein CcmG/thiol:disulfide interchange protein DsbE
VVINFASGACLVGQEAAYLEQTWRKYKDQESSSLVSTTDIEKAALAYIKEFDITYINGPDLGTLISQAYHIKGVPEVLCGKNGELRGTRLVLAGT